MEKKGFVIPIKAFVKIGIAKKYCVTTTKCLVLPTKRLAAGANFLVAERKILFIVPNFVAVRKPFFFRERNTKVQKSKYQTIARMARRQKAGISSRSHPHHLVDVKLGNDREEQAFQLLFLPSHFCRRHLAKLGEHLIQLNRHHE